MVNSGRMKNVIGFLRIFIIWIEGECELLFLVYGRVKVISIFVMVV